MKTKLNLFMMLLLIAIMASCDNGGDGDEDPDLSPANLNGKQITLTESGNVNVWISVPVQALLAKPHSLE